MKEETIYATYKEGIHGKCICNPKDHMNIEYLDNVFGNPLTKIRYRFVGGETNGKIYKSRRYIIWRLFNGPFHDTEVKIFNIN